MTARLAWAREATRRPALESSSGFVTTVAGVAVVALLGPLALAEIAERWRLVEVGGSVHLVRVTRWRP